HGTGDVAGEHRVAVGDGEHEGVVGVVTPEPVLIQFDTGARWVAGDDPRAQDEVRFELRGGDRSSLNVASLDRLRGELQGGDRIGLKLGGGDGVVGDLGFGDASGPGDTTHRGGYTGGLRGRRALHAAGADGD